MTHREIEGLRFNTYHQANEVRDHLMNVGTELGDWAIMHGAEGYRLEFMPASFPPPPVGDVIELTEAMVIEG